MQPNDAWRIRAQKVLTRENKICHYLNKSEPESPEKSCCLLSSSEPRFWSCSAEFTGEMLASHLLFSASSSKDSSNSIWSWGTRSFSDFQAQVSTIQVFIVHWISDFLSREMQEKVYHFVSLCKWDCREGLVTNNTQFPKFPEEDLPVTQRSFVLPVTGYWLQPCSCVLRSPIQKNYIRTNQIKLLSKDYFFFSVSTPWTRSLWWSSLFITWFSM